MGGARSARESRGYKDLTGEPDVIPSINRRIILNYTLNPPTAASGMDRFSRG
jgi:hypothetical protein